MASLEVLPEELLGAIERRGKHRKYYGQLTLVEIVRQRLWQSTDPRCRYWSWAHLGIRCVTQLNRVPDTPRTVAKTLLRDLDLLFSIAAIV
jgi:hypothetical protein